MQTLLRIGIAAVITAFIAGLSLTERTNAFYQSRDSNYNVAISGGGGGSTVAFDVASWARNNNSGITSGGAASGAGFGAGSIVFWTHTPVGTPTAVGVVLQNYEGGTGEAITGVTYGGTSMTLAGTKLAIPTTSTFLYLFCLANPASGAQQIVVQVGTPSFTSIVAGAFTVTNSSTSTCLRSGSYLSNPSGSVTNSISGSVTAQAGDFVFDNVQDWNGSTSLAITKGGGQTSFGFWSLAGQDASYQVATGTSTTMSWSTTGAGNTNWAQLAAAIQHQ